MRSSTSARKGRSNGAGPSSQRSPAPAEVRDRPPTPEAPGRTSLTDTTQPPPTSAPAQSPPAQPTSADPTAAVRPERARGRDPLLAAICHDLRAPLAAVTMGANFVLQTTPEDEASGRSRRVLQAILRSCKQMERLVRDFGDLSEIEGDAVELRLGVHDAALMLEMAAEGARQNALARNVQILVHPPDTPPLVRCDRDRVLRALAHVIDNAVRFSPDGDSVTLAVDETDRHVRFRVTDHGPGLSDETLANLYDRTWHGKRADRVGAGLGLAIVRGFLAAHGGRVEVDSKPGVETTFSLLLPKDAAGSSAPDVTPKTPG